MDSSNLDREGPNVGSARSRRMSGTGEATKVVEASACKADLAGSSPVASLWRCGRIKTRVSAEGKMSFETSLKVKRGRSRALIAIYLIDKIIRPYC